MKTTRPGTDARSSVSGSLVFQCVCGNQIPLKDPKSTSVVCPQCQRTVVPGAVNASMASIDATVIGDVAQQGFETVPFSAGDRLDHFTILNSLGVGGMGAVFRARDESLLRFVAIKVIRGRTNEGGQSRKERLVQEARAQARVNHPNVVHIYYVGTSQDCPFFAMEYVSGQPLAAVLRERRLSFAEIVKIGLQTAEALRYSAAMGIVHGDVKPGNILLDEFGQVKLSDFGLASCETTGAGKLSGPAGTLNYMAPEVAGGQPANIQSDMYSLGVMLYELTFGELPHQSSSDSLQESLRSRQQATVKFPSVWPTDRPESWKDVLAILLHKDPARRFATWDDALRELSRWQPVVLRRAGRIARGFSWLVDLMVLGAILGASQAAILGLRTVFRSKGDWNDWKPLGAMMAVGILLLIIHRLRNSPGKRIMQLQLADEFGLPPTRWKLYASALSTDVILLASLVNSLIVAGSSLIGHATDEDGIPAMIVVGLTAAWIVINGVWMIFSRRQQTLGDRLLGIFVVLDSHPVRNVPAR